MDRGAQFPEEENVCDGCGESLPAGHSHIHLSPEDIDTYKSLAQAAHMQAQMDEHMAKAPANLGDRASLASHLQSPAHWINTHPDHSLELLQDMHADDHDEFEIEHITLNGSHFHSEEE